MFITPFTKGPETWKQYASWHFYVWNANCRVFTQREVPEIGFWGKSSIFTTPLQLSKAGSPTWCLQLETSLGTSYSRAEKPRLQAIKTQAVHSSISIPSHLMSTFFSYVPLRKKEVKVICLKLRHRKVEKNSSTPQVQRFTALTQVQFLFQL